MTARPRFITAAALLLCFPAACGAQQKAPGAASPSVASPSPVPAPADWTLVFSDEFDAPGALDAARWGYETGYIRNKEAQYYTTRPENVRAEGGLLVIEARKEAFQGFAYTSASVNTLGRFEFLYGRVEVRAKLPTGNGTWPAIWMLGVNRKEVGWPACGEIDIMENVGFDPLSISAAIHTAAYNHTIGTQKSAKVDDCESLGGLPRLRDGVVRGPHRHLRGRAEVLHVPQRGDRLETWPFDKPQYLLINLAIGGSWGGQKGIDDARFPHRYVVDYVRVSQQK